MNFFTFMVRILKLQFVKFSNSVKMRISFYRLKSSTTSFVQLLPHPKSSCNHHVILKNRFFGPSATKKCIQSLFKINFLHYRKGDTINGKISNFRGRGSDKNKWARIWQMKLNFLVLFFHANCQSHFSYSLCFVIRAS